MEACLSGRLQIEVDEVAANILETKVEGDAICDDGDVSKRQETCESVKRKDD